MNRWFVGIILVGALAAGATSLAAATAQPAPSASPMATASPTMRP
jgi:hypothetical protein